MPEPRHNCNVIVLRPPPDLRRPPASFFFAAQPCAGARPPSLSGRSPRAKMPTVSRGRAMRLCRLLALSLCCALAACARTPAPVSAPVATPVVATRPVQAVQLLTGHLRDNDLVGFARDAVPPALHAPGNRLAGRPHPLAAGRAAVRRSPAGAAEEPRRARRRSRPAADLRPAVRARRRCRSRARRRRSACSVPSTSRTRATTATTSASTMRS